MIIDSELENSLEEFLIHFPLLIYVFFGKITLAGEDFKMVCEPIFFFFFVTNF